MHLRNGLKRWRVTCRWPPSSRRSRLPPRAAAGEHRRLADAVRHADRQHHRPRPEHHRRARRPAVGVDRADPLGGAGAPRRCRDQPAAGRAGRAGHAASTAATPSMRPSPRRPMLGVTEPHSAGIGGDMFAIYYSAKDHKLYGLNGAGWSPAVLDAQYFDDKGLDAVPDYGVDSVTVPGAVDGWAGCSSRFGTMSLAACAAAVDRDGEAGVRPDRADPRRLEQLRPVLRRHAEEGPGVAQGVPAQRARARRCTASSAIPGWRRRTR